MTEQAGTLRTDAWEQLMATIRDSAGTADPEDVKLLAEAYELLMRHA